MTRDPGDNTTLRAVKAIIAETLGLGDRGTSMSSDTLLLGAIPEFDSMAVVSIITALEERFGFTVADDEISAQTFESLATVTFFVTNKLQS